jgi:hypothetical protein
MRFVTKWVPLVVLFGWAALQPAAAQAQDGRLSLSITPAMVAMEGDAEFALAGTVDYRFAHHLSFEGDVTWINAAAGGFRNRILDFGDGRINATNTINMLMQRTVATFGGRNNRLPNFDTPLGTIVPSITNTGNLSASTGGDTWIGTMGVRYEPTTQTARFQPYVSGGLGVDYTNQDFSLDAASSTRLMDQSITNTGVALSAGGGANIKLAGPVWANADAKYFHLSNDRNVIRFGGGVTLKF